MDIIDSPERLAELKEKFASEISSAEARSPEDLKSNNILSNFNETCQMFQFTRELLSKKINESPNASSSMFLGSSDILKASSESVKKLLKRIS
jgi:hypothetical protein